MATIEDSIREYNEKQSEDFMDFYSSLKMTSVWTISVDSRYSLMTLKADDGLRSVNMVVFSLEFGNEYPYDILKDPDAAREGEKYEFSILYQTAKGGVAARNAMRTLLQSICPKAVILGA